MKIAVLSMGADMSAQVDPSFGRCRYFIIVDSNTMEFDALENSNAIAGGGAGIATGQFVAGKRVSAVLTSHCGPNAFDVLKTAGIKVMTGLSGTVQDAVECYKSGKYQPSSQLDTVPHAGMDHGGSMGRR